MPPGYWTTKQILRLAICYVCGKLDVYNVYCVFLTLDRKTSGVHCGSNYCTKALRVLLPFQIVLTAWLCVSFTLPMTVLKAAVLDSVCSGIGPVWNLDAVSKWSHIRLFPFSCIRTLDIWKSSMFQGLYCWYL